MPRLSRTDILRDFRTRSLLEATRKIIADHGFDAVTMERVARAAGITKGAIYLYFHNKDRLILAALEEIAKVMVGEIEAAIDTGASPWLQLCQLVRAEMESMERYRDVLRTILLVRWRLGDRKERYKWRPLLEYRNSHLARLRLILEAGVKQKIFRRMDTERAAFYINEMAIATAQRWSTEQARGSLREETESLLRFLAFFLKSENGRAKK